MSAAGCEFNVMPLLSGGVEGRTVWRGGLSKTGTSSHILSLTSTFATRDLVAKVDVGFADKDHIPIKGSKSK